MSNPKFTMASDLIKQLQKIIEESGDLPVAIPSDQGFASSAIVYTDPYYYDGGYCARDSEDSSNWIRSTTRNAQGIGSCTPGFSSVFIRLYTDYPSDTHHKIDGRSIREIEPENWDWYDQKELEEKNLFDGELVKYRSEKTKDTKLNCYPFVAYLPSLGMEAIGTGTMGTAREVLTRKFWTYKQLCNNETTVAIALTSPERADREAAEFFLKENDK